MVGLFFRRPLPSLLRVGILAALSLALTFYSTTHPQSRSMGLFLASPVLAADQALVRLWGEGQDYLRSRDQLLRENARLRAELLQAQQELVKLPLIRSENRQLLALLDSFPVPPGRVTVAGVVAQDLSPSNQSIIIDLGSRQGIRVGQPVLAPGGVVGQVVAVSTWNARVALLSDLDSSLPVRPEHSNTPLLLDGTGNLRELRVPFQARDTDLKPGTLLVTSGLGGRFPAGLPVGRITAVERPTDAAFAVVRVRPLAQLGQLNTVLLLWPGTRPSEP
ncbi:rod shape-determining protein MreC [Acidithiobacillus sp.]|uniref:rod shape-determining protein MreC n=1 Tax=Acidithiobacillus sp. TaxID=1872118 RepID=UPI0025C05986|nr:rod shape-determining protein MreC [Acidithiobacillus sp.]